MRQWLEGHGEATGIRSAAPWAELRGRAFLFQAGKAAAPEHRPPAIGETQQEAA